jgi:ketopantoate reductase
MDFIIVGAGAVGAVLGTLLEHAGHRVRYWARARQPKSDAPFEVQRHGGERIQSQPLTWIEANTSPMPPSDWVIVCVRTEQLSAALSQVVQWIGADRAVAIATVTIDGSLAVARKAGLRGPVLALHVAFGSGATRGDARRFTWFPFSAPTTVSAEGQAELRGSATTLATVLADAGLPTRAAFDMGGMMKLMVLTNFALLPSWELCQWNIAALARDRALRLTTARAMHESVRVFAPERGLAHALAVGTPPAVYAFVLRILPWLMGARARDLWLIHGPKVSEQTRYVLRDLLARAKRQQVALPNLAELTARWEKSLAELQPFAPPA